jgi:hypothetical protein
MAEAERGRSHALPVARGLVDACAQALGQRLGRHVAVEDVQSPEMQRRLGGLDVKEQGIERRKASGEHAVGHGVAQ